MSDEFIGGEDAVLEEEGAEAVEGADLGADAGEDTIEDEIPAEEGAEPTADDLAEGEVEEVEVARYRILGLVDYTDAQGNIVGQYKVGSIQEIPVEVGTAAVADGRAEPVGEDEVE